MNYQDAINAPISEKLTKSQLIELANTLQDHCLVTELSDTPSGLQMISEGSVKVFNTIKYELPLLVRDVKNAGVNLKQLVTFK